MQENKRCGFNPRVGKIPWRRAWQPTPIFLPGESRGQRGLADCSPQDHTQSDTSTYGLTYSAEWGHLPGPGIQPVSPAVASGFFVAELPGKPLDWFSLIVTY